MEDWSLVVSISALKGFLLEEALAKLLENCGYTLLTDEVLRSNRDLYSEFVPQGNGWNIKGRGGTHQADVLGQFPISLPFNYPVRLFLEAKFRGKKTDINVVRSGIGILTDLNANYQTIDLRGNELLIQRFNYQYAIFSTSGFSENAIKLAIAYKITLIDLSGEEYRDLLRAIDEVAQEIGRLLLTERFSLSEVKRFIRFELFGLKIEYLERDYNRLFRILQPFFEEIYNYGDLYLASINSPFSILLKPSSPKAVREFFDENRESTFDVSIRWSYDEPNFWRIFLYRDPRLELTFYLPELLKEYIFESRNRPDILLNALDAKERFLGKMIFYMKNAEKFIIFNYGINN